MKNVRFNAHKFLLVSLLSVTAFQAYGMEPLDEIKVTVSPEGQDRILNTVSEWIQKIKNRIVGVEKRQDVTEHNVEVLGEKVHIIEGSVKNVTERVVDLENKVAPQPTAAQKVVDGAKKIGTTVVNAVTEKGAELKDAAVKTGETVAHITKEKVDELKNGAEKLGNEIKKDSKTVGQYLAAKAKAAYNAITGAPQDTCTWISNNPGKTALIAIVAGVTVYLGYQWYKSTKKSARRRVGRNVTANTVTA